MLAWVLANKTVLKYVGICLVFVIALGWVRQRAYDSGYDTGVVKTTESLLEQFKAEKEKLLEEIRVEREGIVQERMAVNRAREEITATRSKINATVVNAINRSYENARQGIDEIRQSKDMGQLGGTIRSLLAEQRKLDDRLGTIAPASVTDSTVIE